MARPKDYTLANNTVSDDFLLVDGATNGTRKLNAFSPTFGGNLTVSGALLSHQTGVVNLSYEGSSLSQLVAYGADASTYGRANIVLRKAGTGVGAVTALSLTDTTATLAGNLTVSGGAATLNNATESYLMLQIGGANKGALDAIGTTLNVLNYSAGTTDFYIGGTNPANKVLSLSTSATTVVGNLTVSGAGTSTFAGATNIFGGQNAGAQVRISADGGATPFGYTWYSGGSYEASLLHVATTGVLTLDVGRNSSWGGKFDIYADTTRAARFTKTATTLDGNLTVSGSTLSVGNGITAAAINIGGGGNTGTQLNITSADGNNDYAVRVLQNSTTSSNGLYVRTKGTRSGDIALYVVSNDGSDAILTAKNDKSVSVGGNLTVSGGGFTLGTTNYAKLTGSSSGIDFDSSAASNSKFSRIEYVSSTQSSFSLYRPDNTAYRLFLSHDTVTSTIRAWNGSLVLTSDSGTVTVSNNLTVSGTGTSSFGGPVTTSGSYFSADGSVYSRSAYSISGTTKVEVGYAPNGYGFGGRSTGAYVAYSDALYFGPLAGSNPNLTLTNAGNVLLGTTVDSGAKLQVGTDTTTSAGGMIFGTDCKLYRSGTRELTFLTSSSPTVVIGGTANGSTTTLKLGDGVNNDQGVITSLGGNLVFKRNTTTVLTLDTSGDATFAGTTLKVTSANSALASLVTSGSSAALNLVSNTQANYRTIAFSYGATPSTLWTIGYNGGTTNTQFNFQSSTGTVVQFTETGAATFSGAIAIGNTVNTVSPTSPNRTITMVIGGTTYYIHAKTTND